MSIRYTKSYNREIQRIVKNFNEKRKRAIKRGFSYVPDKVYVSDLKKRYESRALLNKELRLLKNFNTKRDAALAIEETMGGGKINAWEFDYLKKNKEAAKRYFRRELEEAQIDESPTSVVQAEYINNLRAKINYLEMDVNLMNQTQLNTYRKTVEEYLDVGKRDISAYRGFMAEVEKIMKQMNYSDDQIAKFFQGFNELSPRQFVKLYRENSLIARIYELYLPSGKDGFRLSTSDEDARNLFDTLQEQKAGLIAKYKKL